MEDMDKQNVGEYVRGSMPPKERADFEARLSADPELRRAVEETRVIADGVRFAARNEIRRRAERARGNYRNTHEKHNAMKIVFTFGLLLLLLWWLVAYFSTPAKQKFAPVPQTTPIASGDGGEIPVGGTEYEVVLKGKIGVSKSGRETSFSVSLNPDLTVGTPIYVFYGEDGGLCLYVHPNDLRWKMAKSWAKTGKIAVKEGQYFLWFEGMEYPIVPDEQEHPLNRR